MRPSTLAILSFLSSFHLADAQTADGAIVPFSTLPTCAALCGPLYDVQGKCAPAGGTVDDSCFCSDSRLTAFTTGTDGVKSVCGTASCSETSDLQALEDWYTNFCKANGGTATTATGSAATATSTSKSNGSNSSAGSSWLSTHYKWVIMLVVLFIGIVGAWIAACLFRRRYLRNKEKEIEMLPPIALGPHQLQAMTGGYRYGDGIVDANRRVPDTTGGHHKEMASVAATPSPPRQSKGLTKKRERT